MHYFALALAVSVVATLPRDAEGGPLSAEAEGEFKSELEEASSPLLEAWLLRRIVEMCKREPSACDELALARLFAQIRGGAAAGAYYERRRGGGGRDGSSAEAEAEPRPPPSPEARSVVAAADTSRSARCRRTTVNNILFEIFKRLNIKGRNDLGPRGSTLRLTDQ